MVKSFDADTVLSLLSGCLVIFGLEASAEKILTGRCWRLGVLSAQYMQHRLLAQCSLGRVVRNSLYQA